MWLVLLLFIIGIIYIILKSSSVSKEINKEKIQLYVSKGYNYIQNDISIKYKGGIKNLSVNSYVSIDLLKEGLSFNNGKKIILFKNIEDISLKSETQIQELISLGKMLFFGVWSLAMEKKKKEINNEYIVLKVKDEDGKYNVLLQSNELANNQDSYDKLIKLKNN